MSNLNLFNIVNIPYVDFPQIIFQYNEKHIALPIQIAPDTHTNLTKQEAIDALQLVIDYLKAQP